MHIFFAVGIFYCFFTSPYHIISSTRVSFIMATAIIQLW